MRQGFPSLVFTLPHPNAPLTRPSCFPPLCARCRNAVLTYLWPNATTQFLLLVYIMWVKHSLHRCHVPQDFASCSSLQSSMEHKLRLDLAASLEAVASLRRETNRLKQQTKRKRFDGFTFIQRRAALILYTLGEFDRRPVVFYLLKLMHVLPQSASEADTDQLFSLVEDWFLASTDAEVLTFTHASFPGDDALFRRARAILSDHSLRDWVFSMNICKGLAPTCREVAMRWNDIVAKRYGGCRGPSCMGKG